MKKPNTPPVPSLRLLAESDTVPYVTKSTTFRVDPDKIVFEPGFNLRDQNDELELHIDRLTAAMKAGAFIPPVDVMVKEGVIIARDGHCRTTAAQRVKKDMPEYTLECRQLRGNESDAVLHMLGTGSGQKALTPLEQGRGYLRLIKMGLTSPEIAEKLGVSRVTVDNGLVLAEAPLDVQKMVSSGDVSSTTAREVIKQGPEAIEALKQKVEEEHSNPTPTKAGKQSSKKKVTAKKLEGTAAAKKPAKKKKKEKVVAVASDQIEVRIKKETAQFIVDFLKSNAPDNNIDLNTFIACVELALM